MARSKDQSPGDSGALSFSPCSARRALTRAESWYLVARPSDIASASHRSALAFSARGARLSSELCDTCDPPVGELPAHLTRAATVVRGADANAGHAGTCRSALERTTRRSGRSCHRARHCRHSRLFDGVRSVESWPRRHGRGQRGWRRSECESRIGLRWRGAVRRRTRTVEADLQVEAELRQRLRCSCVPVLSRRDMAVCRERGCCRPRIPHDQEGRGGT